MNLQLHTRAQNSAGERVRIVLNLKSIAYEYVAIPSLRSADFRERNPQGLMPVLDTGVGSIAQSMAIIEWLEETFPEPSIFPMDLTVRAKARAFAQHIGADLHPINNNRVRKYLREKMGVDEPAVQDWYTHWCGLTLASLERSLAEGRHTFAFGETPGIAEAFLVPQMRNCRRFEVDLSPFPRLRALDEQCRELEPFRKAAPEAQPDFAT